MMDLRELRTSRFLGMGCSTFGGSTSASVAKAALNRAYEQGIVYFDVARSYGYGQAEAIVGQFARNKRDEVLITSKFGIVPPQIPFKPLLLWGLRHIRQALPASRQKLNQAGKNTLAKTQFTPQLAETSLHTSLRELKTDYIDLFLLHESCYADSARDDIRAVLDKAKDAGKIRAWGATFSQRTCLQQQLNSATPLAAVQFPFGTDATYARAMRDGNAIQIVYSVLNYYKAQGWSANAALLKELQAAFPALHFLCSSAEALLYLAFSQLQQGVMLSSMTSKANIDRNVTLFNESRQLPATEQDAIQAWLQAHLENGPALMVSD